MELLAADIPFPETELRYANPFQLLVAVVLSAQCTDVRVNLVTPDLFEKFPDAASLAATNFDELFPLIRSISYPNNKTKHLLKLGQQLMDHHGGEVPRSHEDLIKLQGVGRKTANVVTSVLYDEPRMAVDTHVFRVSKRLGIATGKTVLAVEKELTTNIPDELIPKAHHYLILHGRYTCTARSPKCGKCSLTEVCKFFQAEQKKAAKKAGS